LEIRKFQDKDKEVWDNYIEEKENSTLFHLIGWKNIFEKTYKHKSNYLIATEDGKICGIVPLFMVKNPFFGNFIVSNFFGSYEGILADRLEIEKLLLDKAIQITKEGNFDYLLLKENREKKLGLQISKNYFTHILKLKNDNNSLWEKFRPEVRNQIRKAQKSRLYTNFGRKYLKCFSAVLAGNMKRLGTPFYGESFLKNIVREFPERTNIAVVFKDEKIIGGGLLFSFKDTLSMPYASSLSRYFSYCPNNLLYWEVIKHACKKGYRYFDFGRSLKDSGTYIFKEDWGAYSKQLYYYYYLNRIKEIPDITPAAKKYQIYIKIWKKMPLFLTKLLGPKIIKNIP